MVHACTRVDEGRDACGGARLGCARADENRGACGGLWFTCARELTKGGMRVMNDNQ